MKLIDNSGSTVVEYAYLNSDLAAVEVGFLGKLYVVAAYFLEEVVKFQWIIGIVVIHYCHSVPFYTVLLQ